MNLLAVFLGGGTGALCRYLMYIILPKDFMFPLGTLMANFWGCFIATLVFTYFVAKSDMNSIYKTLLVTGFCGGLSTLSALALEVMVYIQNGLIYKAIGYIVLNILLCIISVVTALLIIKKFI